MAERQTLTIEQQVEFDDLRKANIERQAAWCPEQAPDLSFRGNELAGEVGEVCNVIKKLERERLGWRGSRDTVEHLAEELADVVICADLCALSAGIDLEAAVVAKFNATSEKVGLPHRLRALSKQAVGAGEVTYWALCSVSGAHIGLWKSEQTALKVSLEYPGSTIEALYSAQPTAPEALNGGVSGEWVMVPREPTEAMKRAAFGPIIEGGRGGPITKDFLRQQIGINTYKAMLAASPNSVPDSKAVEPVAFILPEDLTRLKEGESIVFYARDRDSLGIPLYAGSPPALTHPEFNVLQALETAEREAEWLRGEGWQDISTAPKDGTWFLGGHNKSAVLAITWFGKTSHVPIYGWCHGEDGEDIDLWQPTHWRPLPAPPALSQHGTMPEGGEDE